MNTRAGCGVTSDTEYLLQSPANAEHLKQSIDQYEQGLSKQDEQDGAGMAWWNGLSEADRRYWCLAAMTVVPAQAWKYFRQVTAPRKTVRESGCD